MALATSPLPGWSCRSEKAPLIKPFGLVLHFPCFLPPPLSPSSFSSGPPLLPFFLHRSILLLFARSFPHYLLTFLFLSLSLPLFLPFSLPHLSGHQIQEASDAPHHIHGWQHQDASGRLWHHCQGALLTTSREDRTERCLWVLPLHSTL